jgi:hypothetical protein
MTVSKAREPQTSAVIGKGRKGRKDRKDRKD